MVNPMRIADSTPLLRTATPPPASAITDPVQLLQALQQAPVATRAETARHLLGNLDQQQLATLARSEEGATALRALDVELADAPPSMDVQADRSRLGGALREGDAARLADQQQALALDLTQIALDVVGIFEPTPFADLTNTGISIGRGNWLDAGLSLVGVIPYIGDLGKLGKLPKLANTIERAVDLAKLDPAFAAQIRPTLQRIRDAIDAVPLDSLPGPARDALQSMKGKLDEFFSAGVNTAQAVTRSSARVGDNTVTWTLDAAGRPIRAEATLTEVFTGAARGSDEVAAQSTAASRGVDGDQGGHIIGHRFVTDQGLRNLFPQNGNFNVSAYKKLENEWADWIGSGKDVRITVDLGPAGQARPDRVRVSYEVVDPASGRVVYDQRVSFRNEAGQTFDRVPRADMANY